MSGHVGIPSARDARGRSFGYLAIDDDPQPFEKPLICGGCETRVDPVRGYVRRDSTSVRAHYRLTNRAQAPHADGCPYDFDAEVGRLLVEHRREIERNGDVYELRLPDLSGGVDEAAPDPVAESGARDRLVVHEQPGRRLPPALMAAAAVARLLRVYEDDPEAQARFRASWNGRTIPWGDFYFDVARDALRLGQVIRAEKGYPVAVAGTVKKLGESASGQSYVELDTVRGVPDKASARWIHVRAYSNQAKHLPFETGQRVLGYGHWKAYAPDDSSSIFFNLWVDHRSLIATVD